MNASNAKDYLPLVQALADGKVIQIRKGDGWAELEKYDFTSPAIDYRIKPEPREKWFNRSMTGFEVGPYDSEHEAKSAVISSPGMVGQICYREVLE